ncbi:serine/threonine-protein kinase fhke-related [Anaeramoeba ignava]|uniref:Serine/threonine-protein kinase fhke-related n=1 Tax=Anaeramoeba ignava TaxID=1746090 RepID=A0A9Q0LX17_ANAIG|nr:serine/threonine-protein kinase fhke-related [Anaeramoeba ignava]
MEAEYWDIEMKETQTQAKETKTKKALLASLNPSFSTIKIEKNEIKIGRGSSCDFIINDPHISDIHCIISKNNSSGAYYVKDLSTNGTFIQSEKIGKNNSRIINHGDELVLFYGNSRKQNDSNSIISYIFVEPSQQSPKFDFITEMEEDEIGKLYSCQKKLGEGCFGTVYSGIRKSDGFPCALKVISKEKANQQGAMDTILDEVYILQSINHHNIVSVYDVFDSENYVVLVLELVTGGELLDLIAKSTLNEEEALFLFYQILTAISYLHKNGIAHRDLKPENILLKKDSTPHIKITDFGISKVVNEQKLMKTICGTPLYLAPEMLIYPDQGYTFAVDMWSAGIILYQLLTGVTPFNFSFFPNTPFEIQSFYSKIDFDSNSLPKISDSAKDLVRNLLKVNPNQRLTADQALNHPWIKSNREKLESLNSSKPSKKPTIKI